MKNETRPCMETAGRRPSRFLALLALSLLATSCSKPEVACKEMAAPPKVTVEGKTVVVAVEPLKQEPSVFVETQIRFDGREIQLQGTRLFRKSFKKRSKIPEASLEAKGAWKAYWTDPDGTVTRLPVELGADQPGLNNQDEE